MDHLALVETLMVWNSEPSNRKLHADFRQSLGLLIERGIGARSLCMSPPRLTGRACCPVEHEGSVRRAREPLAPNNPADIASITKA